jgi:hypothetical protein
VKIQPSRNPFKSDTQLFFVHIPKTAGTTFIGILDSSYAQQDICPIHWPYSELKQAYDSGALQAFPFIRGHFSYDLVKQLQDDVVTISFLRDPVDRMISEFYQSQRAPIHPKYDATQGLTLDEFVNQSPELPYYTNAVTRYLTLSQEHVPLEDRTPSLEEAKEILSQLDFVGITELFDESMQLFEAVFDIPPIAHYTTRNVAPKRTHISQATRDRIAELNAADIELYYYGKALVEERIRQLEPREQTYQDSRMRDAISIDFQRVYPGQGWQLAEVHPVHGTIRWTGPAPQSHLYYSIPSDVNYDVRLRVVNTIAPHVLESLQLMVNDHPVPLTATPDGEFGEVVFSGHILSTMLNPAPNTNRFTIQVDETLSPYAITDGDNDDKRQLGICVNWLIVQPA